ncbi:MAG: hypothetical protein AMXMBFR48_18400 [Ignavibacteriales bacterium]
MKKSVFLDRIRRFLRFGQILAEVRIYSLPEINSKPILPILKKNESYSMAEVRKKISNLIGKT